MVVSVSLLIFGEIKKNIEEKFSVKKFDVIKTSPTVVELCEEVLKEKERTLKESPFACQ